MLPGRPTSPAQRICSSAICGLVLNVISSGTPALARRSSSSAQAFGRYSRYATGRLAWRLASDRVTATWQFACLPSCPQYWCDTPTECCPFLGRPVSSMIQASIGPSRVICGRSEEHTSELQSHLNLVCRLLLEKKKAHLRTPVTLESRMRPPA